MAATERGLELRNIAGDIAGATGDDGLLVCRVATGRVNVTDLAIDASGTQLAVAADGHVRTWSLRPHRAQTLRQPDFDNDRPDLAVDHLDTGRDARAIAALIASKDLVPPLSIGLFGDWGSGKSFVLRQIKTELEADKPPGFLEHLRVVEFNAWQYSETNLWASLVDAVLRAIGPLQAPPPPHEVAEAQARQQEAEARKKATTEQLREGEGGGRPRPSASWRSDAGSSATWRVACCSSLRGSSPRWLSAGSRVSPHSGPSWCPSPGSRRWWSARRRAPRRRPTRSRRPWQVARTSRATSSDGQESQLLAMRVAEREEADRQVDAAAVLLEERTAQVTTAQEHAEKEPLQALLHGLADLREYRDQLSMVTRVHDLFDDIDRAVRVTRGRGGEIEADAGSRRDPDDEDAARAATSTASSS